MGKTFNRVEFTGHSDDIISVKKCRTVQFCDRMGDSIQEDEDEISADNGKFTVVRVQNIGGSRCCNVIAFYDGTWSFAVSMIEEERKLPPWTFTIDQPDHKYSTRLIIESEEDELVVDDLRDKDEDED
jgi:hypothetical protein